MDEYRYPITVEGSWETIVSKGIKNKLHIYFQSKKKSKGGDCIVEYGDHSSNKATVFFKSEDVRERVLANDNHVIATEKGSIELRVSFPVGNKEVESYQLSDPASTEIPVPGGGSWTVDLPDSESRPEPSPVPEAGARPDVESRPEPSPVPEAGARSEFEAAVEDEAEETPQSTAVVLNGIPDSMSKDMLGMMVEAVCRLDEDNFSLELISEISTAVVTFKNPNDVGRFLAESRTHKKFQQHGLTVRMLERFQSLRVENLTPATDKEMLELYFERWDAPLKDITMIPEEHAAIVTFDGPEVAEKMQKRDHVVYKAPVNVYPYYQSLGITLYGNDRPMWKMPSAFTESVHPAVWRFLLMKRQLATINNQMRTYFCQVDMEKPEARLSPLPSLLRQRDLTGQQLDKWTENASIAFCKILAPYSAFECEMNGPAWKSMEKELRSVVKGDAILIPDASRGALTVAGLAEDMRRIRGPVENLMRKALDQIERQTDGISEEMVMSPSKFYILQQDGLQKAAEAISPKMRLSYKNDTNKLVLSGLTTEVYKVKNWILEKELQMNKRLLDVDPVLLDFLRSVDCREMSQDLFTSRDISAMYSIEDRGILLTGSTDKALAEAEKRVKAALSLQHINAEDQEVLKMDEWKKLNQQLLNTYNSSRRKTVEVKSDPLGGGRITVFGFLDPVKEVSCSLQDFIEKFSRVEESVRVKSCAVAKYIEEKKSQEWTSFAKADKVEVHFNPKRPRIYMCGARIHVRKAKTAFQKMAENLCTDEFKIVKPGAKKYFLQNGSLFLFTAMANYNCVVLLQEDHMLDEEQEEDEEEEKGFGSLSYCEVQTASGVLVSVKKADICKFRADAVVNAANEDLKHIGGVALALLIGAGQRLQQLSDDHVSRHGRLQPGEAVVTEAGNLPCKYVVHAVGPRYADFDQRTAVLRLKGAVRESLRQATRVNCSTVAIPAVSSGIFGFPLDLCSDTIAQGVREYCDKQASGQGSLTEIHLVDKNDKTVIALAKAVQKVFNDMSPRMSFPDQGAVRGRGSRGRGQRGHRHQGPGSRGPSSKGHGHWEQKGRGHVGRGNVNRGSYHGNREAAGPQGQLGRNQGLEGGDREGVLVTKHTPEGLKITLRKGNIEDQFTDAIVNTISDNVNLSQGAVSKAILQAAGPQLQSEARVEAGASRLSHGQVLVTSGYNLQCQRVFHAVCPFWDNGAGPAEEVLTKIIRLCLREAEKLRLGSLSFPAIGTGNLSFPIPLVSSLVLQEVTNFSQRRTPEYLKEVAIVVHPSDAQTVDGFAREFKGQPQGTSPLRTHSAAQSHQIKSQDSQSQQSSAFFGQVSSPSLGVHRMQIGHLTFEVSSGDITKETSDVIINSSNKDFSLKAGVSKAILDAAGVSVIQECSQIVSSPQFLPCSLIMTTAGHLACKNIIHIVGQSDPRHIKEVVYAVLKKCEENKFNSVAFPALGTGQGGVSPSVVADAMIDAVVDFVRKKNGRFVKSVKILIFQTAMVADFHKSMKKREGETADEKSLFTKFKDSIMNLSSYLKGYSDERSESERLVMKGEEFAPTVFQLCADNPQAVSKAKTWISDLIVKEQTEKTIKDEYISQLNTGDLEQLQALQKELTVSIHLEKKGPDSFIRLEGLSRDVLTADEKIRDMIHRVERSENRKQKAFLMSSLLEWQYQDPTGAMVPFDIITNYDLEEAFGKKHSLRIKINNDDYDADVIRKTAVKIGGRRQIELFRKDLKADASVALPTHWEDMKGSLVKLVPLTTGSQEYKEVDQECRRTQLNLNIIKIERVQNESLWQSYQIRKKHLEDKNKHKNNEKQLFHGTNSTGIDHINNHGFNRSYAGQHGAAYGNGTYFAVDPAYSANGYAKPDGQGHKRMFLARVLVGDFTRGAGGLIVPPTKAGTTELYDSVTDKPATPTMFVIFNDIQAYPEYLITFQ